MESCKNLLWIKKLLNSFLHKIFKKVETVSGNVTQFKVNRLTAKKNYKFRVRAVNQEGESPNLETSNQILAKNPFDEPSSPGSPEITDWDRVE